MDSPSRFASAATKEESMEILWALLGVLYVVLVITLGVMTFRGGHYWMFWLGFFIPLLWIVGALIEPTEAARERAALRAGVA
jgi:ABC-type multidrug transport system permease subunit